MRSKPVRVEDVGVRQWVSFRGHNNSVCSFEAAEVLSYDEQHGDELCEVQGTTFESPSMPSTRARDKVESRVALQSVLRSLKSQDWCGNTCTSRGRGQDRRGDLVR